MMTALQRWMQRGNMFNSDRLFKIITALTILSTIAAVIFWLSLAAYLLTGDPAHDIGHFIKVIREEAA